jgi:hypothetical protein
MHGPIFPQYSGISSHSKGACIFEKSDGDGNGNSDSNVNKANTNYIALTTARKKTLPGCA